MLRASYIPYRLNFRFEAGTSRGVLTEKTSWLLRVWDDRKPEVIGIGEVGPLKGLSPDDDAVTLQQKLDEICAHVDELSAQVSAHPEVRSYFQLLNFPSIVFGLETALMDLHYGGQYKLFDTPFFQGQQTIPINGLIWMGEEQFMQEQIGNKLAEGYRCLKMKIGAIGIEKELKLLKALRKQFTPEQLTLRVDANGAFNTFDVMPVLHELAKLHIHSIEQPLKAGQWLAMKEVCHVSPVAVALDEELIGVYTLEEKSKLLDTIQPHYIILKPTLHGGIASCKEWINLAEERKIGWWITSMLESNVGLNAIAQFTSSLNCTLPQGLGTGQLYHNNIHSPLVIDQGYLKYDTSIAWENSFK